MPRHLHIVDHPLSIETRRELRDNASAVYAEAVTLLLDMKHKWEMSGQRGTPLERAARNGLEWATKKADDAHDALMEAAREAIG